MEVKRSSNYGGKGKYGEEERLSGQITVPDKMNNIKEIEERKRMRGNE